MDSELWEIGLFAVLSEDEELVGELTIEFYDSDGNEMFIVIAYMSTDSTMPDQFPQFIIGKDTGRPHALKQTGLSPLLKTPVDSAWRSKTARYGLPSESCIKQEEYSFHNLPIVYTWPPKPDPGDFRWQQWLNLSPDLV